MKKVFLTLAVVFTLSTSFVSCRETAEDDVEEVADDMEDAADDVGDALDDN